MDFGPIRVIEGDTILSPSLPRLGVRISSDYIYVGDLQYIARETHHVEEFIFLSPNAIGHVTRLLLVHFSGFLENKAGKYDRPNGQAIKLGGEEYGYEISFINVQEYLKQHQDSALSYAADYIRQRAYTLAGDMTYQRFVRIVSADNRNEFTIAYLERNDEPALTFEIMQQEPEKAKALRERALNSFTILHES